ncbi:hypothetical protein DYH55_20165 [Methylovirgula sp. 4M-Z18]|uniref:Bax inhibitor-1 family protein n=1 Tax=Methylovirgula sp. 4M-Z18 TaxID=2293567 RepID=UPI000E2E8C11|nr:Bax inhibitor-1 family protein [Methylovirgula sp. 4M-Z18]RFB76458.1 hypothetical protein DYH55_20165 [Methylovirgula sp. 4M-Z18]
MILISVMLASAVNPFFASTILEFAISLVGIALFSRLTAYDTQRINEIYIQSDCDEALSKRAVMGALTLYLDFINLFVMLLRFTGQRRD